MPLVRVTGGREDFVSPLKGGSDKSCPFCAIVAGKAPAEFVGRREGAVAFVPLNPVTEGHVLVVPEEHARYIWELTPTAMDAAMWLVQDTAKNKTCNVIQSNGVAATQTIPHVHFHVVPRTGFDGLELPWTGQKKAVPIPKMEGPSD